MSKVIGMYTHRGFIPCGESEAITSGFTFGEYSMNSLKKQGKYVIFNFYVGISGSCTNGADITFPVGYAPKENVAAYMRIKQTGILPTLGEDCLINITPQGITLPDEAIGKEISLYNIGWETE